MSGKPGRPPSYLLQDPTAIRGRGVDEWARITSADEEKACRWRNGPFPTTVRRRPADPLADGLAIAWRAGVVSPQAAKAIERKARALEGWLDDVDGSGSGPEKDAGLIVRTWVARALAGQARAHAERLSGRPARSRRKPAAVEIARAWQILFDEEIAPATIRKRLECYGALLDAFERSHS